jgi:hypothetical protein
VWELLCSICTTFPLCISCIWHGMCNMIYRHPCILDCSILYHIHLLGKASPIVVWTSLGPLPQWVPGPTTRWARGTTRLVPHGT